MKKLFSLLTLALLTMSAWAEKTVTFDLTTGYENGQEVTSVTDADGLVTLTFDKGTNSNAPKYYTTGNAVRVYGGGTLTVSVANSSDPITGMTFTFGSGDGSNAITSDVGTFASPNWAGEASEVIFTVGGTTGHRRFAKIEVTLGGQPTDLVAAPKLTDSQSFETSMSVEITDIAEGATAMYSTDEKATWNTYSEPFTITETTTVYAKAVKGNVESEIVSATYTKVEVQHVSTLSAANGLDDNVHLTFDGNVVVVYKNGSNLWIKDETASGLIFGSSLTNFEQGTVLNSGWSAKKVTYQQIIPEFQNPSNVTASEQEKVTVEPTVVEISAIDASMMNDYIRINDVTIDSISSSDNKNYYANGMVLRNQFGGITLEAGKTYSLIGLATAYQGVPQVYITEVVDAPLPEVVDVNNIAEALALDEGTKFTMYNDVVVTYHNGSRLFIRDTKGNSGMIYGNVGATFNNGQVLSDGWTATYTVYNGLPEFTNPAEVAADGDNTRDAAPYERTSTAITADNVNEYVIMKGLTIVPDEENTKNFYVGDLLLYDQFNVKPNIEDGETYDVVGAVTIHNNNVQVYIISVTKVGGTTPVIEPEAGDYVKVTRTEDLTSGEYLIVYEAGNLAFDGGLEILDAAGNSIEVEIVENQLIKGGEAVDAAIFTYDAEAGTLMSASGYYIGRTASSNGMNTSTETLYTNTLSINENGDADIVAEAGHYLRYNASSGQERFRYFKADSYTNQKAIQLYKKVEGEQPAGLRGDVNNDKVVNISDVTVLIDYLLNPATVINEANANVNLDEAINISDVTVLIDFLLSGTWPNK